MSASTNIQGAWSFVWPRWFDRCYTQWLEPHQRLTIYAAYKPPLKCYYFLNDNTVFLY